jgi:Fe-S-cluster containining protein
MAAKTTPASNGCSGTCCAAFRLDYTLTEMRRAPVDSAGGVPLGDKWIDPSERDQLVDMLVPLTPKEARERNQKFGGNENDKTHWPWSDRGHQFTCRHWDEDTRLCGIYEDRPMMCREFPYGKPCSFGCSCTEGKKRGDNAAGD